MESPRTRLNTGALFWFSDCVLSLDSAGHEAVLDLLGEEDVDEQRREGGKHQGSADGTPFRRILAGEGLNADRQGPQFAFRNKDVGKHQLVPALQEGIDANGGDSRFHQRQDDAPEDAPGSAAVDAGRFVQFPRDLVHEAGADQDGH